LADQMCSAAASVTANIAEGDCRASAGEKETRRRVGQKLLGEGGAGNIWRGL